MKYFDNMGSAHTFLRSETNTNVNTLGILPYKEVKYNQNDV